MRGGIINGLEADGDAAEATFPGDKFGTLKSDAITDKTVINVIFPMAKFPEFGSFAPGFSLVFSR